MITEDEVHARPADAAVVDDRPRLPGALSKLVFASIGALSLAEETAGNVLHRLVERGERDMQHARGTVTSLRARRHLPGTRRPVIAIGTENLASKADIAALEAQIAALSAELARLNQHKTGGA
jgi:polyhydroxyalkanoate synthesis regulator phasin